RDECERRAGLRRQLGQASPHELVQSLGHGQRLGGVDLFVESARDLERIERIAARVLVDTQQSLAREDAVQAISEECVQGTGAERPKRQPPNGRRRQCTLELRWLCSVREPTRKQQKHWARVESPQRERE